MLTTQKNLTVDSIAGAEQELFSRDYPGLESGCIFILGAPRTGSTVLYQAMSSAFKLPFISNFTNTYFSSAPIVGLAIQNGISSEISFKSSFGKTMGAFEPSEGSAVMSQWFGGGHPSQTVSARILDGREEHFIKTLRAAEGLFGRPLLLKNAWHCFRVDYLAAVLPRAKFVWIRRDIAAAALSDLEARYETKGDAHSWNSATPSNVEELAQRPPVEQVVENQFEFNSAISSSFARGAVGRHFEVWYEELLLEPRAVLLALAKSLDLPLTGPIPALSPSGTRRSHVSDKETHLLRQYISANLERFAPSQYDARG